MDPIKTIGKKLRGDEQRDAIHIAIMPVVTSEDYMQPGQSVAFVYGTTNMVRPCNPAYALKPVGVLDPFYDRDYGLIKKGTRMWLFLKPGTITGLRHEWTHPDVDNPPVEKDEHEKWLRQFADRWRFVYDEMIEAATATSTGSFDNFITAQGRDLHSASELGEDHDLFWEHLEGLTGKRFDSDHRQNFGWSCTC